MITSEINSLNRHLINQAGFKQPLIKTLRDYEEQKETKNSLLVGYVPALGIYKSSNNNLSFGKRAADGVFSEDDFKKTVFDSKYFVHHPDIYQIQAARSIRKRINGIFCEYKN